MKRSSLYIHLEISHPHIYLCAFTFSPLSYSHSLVPRESCSGSDGQLRPKKSRRRREREAIGEIGKEGERQRNIFRPRPIKLRVLNFPSKVRFIFSTGRPDDRMPHRKYRETKQHMIWRPDLALLGCCLVSLHFLCDIPSGRPEV